MEDKKKGGEYQFKSLEEAGNYIQDLKDKIKRRAGAEEFPVTTALPEERKAFLNYCIRLLAEEKRFGEYVQLLRLRVEGYSIKRIAYLFEVPEEVVRYMEQEAIKRVKDAIVRKKANSIPLVGG